MSFVRCFITSLLLFVLLSCSSDSAYPYTIVKDDPYNTRLYLLPNGVKLYIANTTDQPRVKAAVYMPSVSSDTLKNLFKSSVYSPEYPLLFASIGSEVSNVADYKGSCIVYNDIPSNELENWAVIMQGSFAILPDSISVFLFGDVVCDDAVGILMRSFEKTAFFQPSTTAYVNDEKSLLTNFRTLFAVNISDAEYKKTVSLSDVRCDVKNDIKIFSSPPAKIAFSDIDKLKIKYVPEQPKMVVAENSDSLFTFVVRTRLKELPISFLALVKEYFDAFINIESDSMACVTQIRIDKNFHTLEYSLSGDVKDMQQIVSSAFKLWKSLADADRFYDYLLANSEVVVASKNKYENIAMQAATYIVGGKRLCGMRDMAEYSMNALFTSSSEVLFSGKDANVAYSLFLDILNPIASPIYSDFFAVDDSIAKYLLLPADVHSSITVSLGDSCDGIEDFAAIALLNKAASLSSATPLFAAYLNGAIFSVADYMPFTRSVFEAAKSFLLYECSTQGCDGLSLIKEYVFLNEYGYTSSQYYDALMSLSYSDIEDFYMCHKESSTTHLIVGRESNPDMRKLKTRERVVHLTSDELFGY